MPLTVSGVVADVVGRLRGKLAFVGLSVVKDSTNVDVVPAVRDALSYVGLTSADPENVADSDLASIANPKLFRDAATLETLYIIRGAFSEFDETLGVHEQKIDQVRAGIETMIADLESRVPKPNIITAALGNMAMLPMPNDPFIPCISRTPCWTYPYPAGIQNPVNPSGC